jgi:hypothetical protein
MPYINLPASLRALFKDYDTRLQKLETGKRFTIPNMNPDPQIYRLGDEWINSSTGLFKVVDKNNAIMYAIPSQINARIIMSASASLSTTTGVEATITGFDTATSNQITVSASAGSITIPFTGRYAITAAILWVTGNATGYRRIRLMANGTTEILRTTDTPATTNAHQSLLNLTDYNFTAGDVLTLLALQNSGSSLTIGGIAAPLTFFTVTYVGK